MTFLKLNINKVTNLQLQKILHRIDKAMKDYGVEFYLIGARARDFWLAAKDIAPRRFTDDIDFAILMDSIEQYEDLKDYLVNTGHFIKCTNLPQRMYTTDKSLIIDLLPFGKVEQGYYVTFKDREKTRMATLGLMEVFKKSTSVKINDNFEILTASLPGLVILKLIAWNERPDIRRKDIIDISFIIENYFNLQDELIYEQYNQYFGGDYDIDQIAALALGFEMNKILSASDTLHKVVLEILNKHITMKSYSAMVQIIAEETGYDTEKVIEYIELIKKGINK